jgi:hypothetical protein
VKKQQPKGPDKPAVTVGRERFTGSVNELRPGKVLVPVEMPHDLLARLDALAEHNARGRSAEVVLALEAHCAAGGFPPGSTTPPPPPQRRKRKGGGG